MISMLVPQECEQELTQKGEMVSRLQAKTIQIGNLLSGLQRCNGVKDAQGQPLTLPLVSPTVPQAGFVSSTPTGSNKAATPSSAYRVAPIPPWDGSSMRTPTSNTNMSVGTKATTPSQTQPKFPLNNQWKNSCRSGFEWDTTSFSFLEISGTSMWSIFAWISCVIRLVSFSVF